LAIFASAIASIRIHFSRQTAARALLDQDKTLKDTIRPSVPKKPLDHVVQLRAAALGPRMFPQSARNRAAGHRYTREELPQMHLYDAHPTGSDENRCIQLDLNQSIFRR
jgi:hypothetical protein